MIKKEPVKGGGSHLDPSTAVEVMFVRNLVEEFLEVLFVKKFECTLQCVMFSTVTKYFYLNVLC